MKSGRCYHPGGKIGKFLQSWKWNRAGFTILEVKSGRFYHPEGEIRNVLQTWRWNQADFIILKVKSGRFYHPGGEIRKVLPSWRWNQAVFTILGVKSGRFYILEVKSERFYILELKSESFYHPRGEIRQVLQSWRRNQRGFTILEGKSCLFPGTPVCWTVSHWDLAVGCLILFCCLTLKLPAFIPREARQFQVSQMPPNSQLLQELEVCLED